MPRIYGRTFLSSAALSLALTFSSNAQTTLPLDAEINPSATTGCATNVTPPAPQSRAPANAIKVLAPQRGIYQGAFQIPANPRQTQRFAQSVGHMPPILFSFHDMFAEDNNGKTPDRTFDSKMEGDGALRPLELAAYLDQRGSVLSLAWAIYCCDIENTRFWLGLKKPHDHFNRILAGQHDAFLRETARKIKAYGRPIMLTVVPEFNWQGQFLFGADGREWAERTDHLCNQYGDPSWPDGPERVRDTFRHIIDLFRAEGVNNVTWFMYGATDYMAEVEGQSRWLHPKYYYPGDAYIDWVGNSVYFTPEGFTEKPVETQYFYKAAVPAYNAWRSVTNKPIYLPEFGISAFKSQNRAPAWSQLFTQQLTQMPGVKALTIADSLLFEQIFDQPRLHAAPNETAAIRQAAQTTPSTANAPLRLSR